MIICRKAADISLISSEIRQQNKTLGFIPTMGALHRGHLSLIHASVDQGHYTCASIFINPTQFNNASDFEKYPVDVERDIDLLEEAGCDLLFLPSISEIYPEGYTAPHYELSYLENIFEGEFRPGHFQGVCMVVDRLLQIFQPDILFLGRKDYQQCMVLNLLTSQSHSATRINVCDTVREADGLAMSSRNLRLSDEQRKLAPSIFVALSHVKFGIGKVPLNKLIEEGKNELIDKGFRIDYFAVADAGSLEPVTHWNGKTKIIALVAAYLGDIRLIDNIALN